MGTHHLMGLGRSPGTVIGPLTCLAHRYQRWNADDQRFFARSGEVRQRRAGEKVGDVDPRGIRAYCFTISDKARAIGGGVLEAILYARR